MTAVIRDRLLHKSVVLNIRGRSYRLRDLEKLLKWGNVRCPIYRGRQEEVCYTMYS